MKQIISFLFIFLSMQGQAQRDVKPYGALPNANQLQWHKMEQIAIIHLALVTYDDKEWGFGDTSPKVFNPVNFDANKIIKTVKDAGMKGIILVTKHHEGFCLWPTKTTDYNISKSPYKDGKADMVKEYADACKKYGIKLGLYLSPWDRNNQYYGTDKYVTDVFMGQLRELLTNYGEVFEIWFDGANGGDGYYGGAREIRKINNKTYYRWNEVLAMCKQLQPKAVFFNGTSLRWIGNEDGIAGETNWCTLSDDPNTIIDGSTNGIEGGNIWAPAEADFRLRNGWVYHKAEDNTVKQPSVLLERYMTTVGRNAMFNIGLTPNKLGEFHQNDIDALLGYKKLMDESFGVNLAINAKIQATNGRREYSPKQLIDNNRDSFWAAKENCMTSEITFSFDKSIEVNAIALQEYIEKGQRIKAFSVEALVDGKMKTLCHATTIGYKRIIRFPTVFTNRVIVRIKDSKASPVLSEIMFFKMADVIDQPIISRNTNGMIKLSTSLSGINIHYSTDGSEPDDKSPLFTQAFEAKGSVLVKAKAFSSTYKLSSGTVERQYGMLPTNWKVLECDNEMKEYPASNAIDGNSNSYWFTDWKNKELKHPHFLVIDLGSEIKFSALQIVPQFGVWRSGNIGECSFSISTDKINWIKVQQKEFSNMQNSPDFQQFKLEMPIKTRYLKIEALKPANPDQHWCNIAEVELVN
jgi:alpha-L-fucosidase